MCLWCERRVGRERFSISGGAAPICSTTAYVHSVCLSVCARVADTNGLTDETNARLTIEVAQRGAVRGGCTRRTARSQRLSPARPSRRSAPLPPQRRLLQRSRTCTVVLSLRWMRFKRKVQYQADSAAPAVQCGMLSTSEQLTHFERLLDAFKRHAARLAALVPPTPATLPNPVSLSRHRSSNLSVAFISGLVGERAQLSRSRRRLSGQLWCCRIATMVSVL